MKKKSWIHWPNNKNPNLVPWYIVLRRSVFMPVILTGYFMTLVGLLAGYGLAEARRFWKSCC